METNKFAFNRIIEEFTSKYSITSKKITLHRLNDQNIIDYLFI